MGRTRNPRYTEAMSRRKHHTDMESIRKHDLSIEDREERQKALIPEANLVCLKERCWLHGRLCKPKKEKCDAYF
jgi:hypothetical protein